MREILLSWGYLKTVRTLAMTWSKQNKLSGQVIYKKWKLFLASLNNYNCVVLKVFSFGQISLCKMGDNTSLEWFNIEC